MSQQPTIAPHDCLGSNIYAHVHGRSRQAGGAAAPVRPSTKPGCRTGIASATKGLYAEDRLAAANVRERRRIGVTRAGTKRWIVAGRLVSQADEHGGAADSAPWCLPAHDRGGGLPAVLGCMAHLGIRQHRLSLAAPRFPWPGVRPAVSRGWAWPLPSGGGSWTQMLVVGSNLRREVPLLAHRVRKAALRGAGVHFAESGALSVTCFRSVSTSGRRLSRFLAGTCRRWFVQQLGRKPVAADIRGHWPTASGARRAAHRTLVARLRRVSDQRAARPDQPAPSAVCRD